MHISDFGVNCSFGKKIMAGGLKKNKKPTKSISWLELSERNNNKNEILRLIIHKNVNNRLKWFVATEGTSAL